jgi:hypothetical protein
MSTYISNITDVFANRTYYLRAYATNSSGTAYGPEKVFTTTTPSTPYVGQNYAGGIVFLVDLTGLHGLICAASDQGQYAWGCSGTSIQTSTDIGTGATNTAAIVAICEESNIAAKICNDLVLNDYADWFLPSYNELALMYANLKAQGDIGSFNNGFYWPSSETTNSTVYGLVFSNGFSTFYNKGEARNVRAVRAF